MADLAEKLVPVARALLHDGETLVGCCVATWQKTLSGSLMAIAVAGDRIVVQRVDRRFSAAGDALSLPRERLARVRLVNGVGGSVSIPSIIMDAVAVTADLTTTDGLRIKLSLMVSGGSLTGGRVQHDGVAALLAFLEPLTADRA
jgi:hypothetical protein